MSEPEHIRITQLILDLRTLKRQLYHMESEPFLWEAERARWIEKRISRKKRQLEEMGR